MKPMFGTGTSNWPQALPPHVMTEPLVFSPRLCLKPAATAVNPLLGAGTLSWPQQFSPHATIDPLLFKPKMKLPPPATETKPALGSGTLQMPQLPHSTIDPSVCANDCFASTTTVIIP